MRSPLLAAALLLSTALPLTAQQQCLTPEPQPTASITTPFVDEAFRVLAETWRPDWGRTVGTVFPANPDQPDPAFHDDHVQLWSDGAPRAALDELSTELEGYIRRDQVERPIPFFLSTGETFAPFVVDRLAMCPPSMVNAMELGRALKEAGDELELEESRQAQVSLFVSVEGVVTQSKLQESSGLGRADDAALDLARLARFEPARIEGIERGLWVTFPIRFQLG